MRQFIVALVSSIVFVSTASAAPDWAAILGAPQGVVAPPQDSVVWSEQLAPAMEEAKRTNRPVFVTLRCLPCKQCADFDKDVLEGGTELDPLLKQFVTVRLTDAAAMDLRMMPIEGFQDLDLSWWGYFFSPEGRLYAIFGGKDHVSDSTRISTAALISTMRRVLAHHYDPRRSEWDIDGLLPAAKPMPVIRELPGFSEWSAARPWTAKAQCVHCHEVGEVLRQPAISAGTFDKLRDTQVWPLPENVGVELDRDHGLLVTRVTPGSAAAKAGLQPGDVLGAAGGRKLFGQADFRGVLHRGPQRDGEIDLVWLRLAQPMTGTLTLTDGWRKTELGWRTSIAFGNIGAFPGFWVAPPPANQSGGLAIKPHFGKDMKSPAYDAGLRPNHIIIAVDGQSPDLNGRAFMTWFRMRYEPGDTVTLTVKDGGKQREIRYVVRSTAR